MTQASASTAMGVRRVHSTAAMLACGLAPIGGWGDGIAVWLCGLAAIAAIPLLIPHASYFLTRPVILIYGLFWLLVVASQSWAPASAAPNMSPLWTLLVIPALLPLARRPTLVLWAIAAGVTAQALIQTGGAVGFFEAPDERSWRSSPGLYWYPASVAVWSMCGVLLSLALARAGRTRLQRSVAIVFVLCAAAGLALTLNRAAWLTAGIGIGILAVRWIWSACHTRRAVTTVLALSLLPVVIGVSAYFGSKIVRYRVQHAAREVAAIWQPSADGSLAPNSNSLGMRVLWWHAGWDLMWQRPLTGNGAGAVAESLARLESELPSNQGAGLRGFITHNPHCSLVAAAIEQGIPGAALLILTGITTVAGTWRRGIGAMALSSLGPATIALLLFGTVHAILLEPYTATLVAILVALSIAPPPKPACRRGGAASCDTMTA